LSIRVNLNNTHLCGSQGADLTAALASDLLSASASVSRRFRGHLDFGFARFGVDVLVALAHKHDTLIKKLGAIAGQPRQFFDISR